MLEAFWSFNQSQNSSWTENYTGEDWINLSFVKGPIKAVPSFRMKLKE